MSRALKQAAVIFSGLILLMGMAWGIIAVGVYIGGEIAFVTSFVAAIAFSFAGGWFGAAMVFESELFN